LFILVSVTVPSAAQPEVIEECPSLMTPSLQKVGSAAVKLAKSVGYENAGTIEFLVDHDRHFYFIDEHAHSGGAHNYGGGLRVRPCQGTDPHAAGSRFAARRTRPRGCMRSSAASTPKIRRRVFNRRPGESLFIMLPVVAAFESIRMFTLVTPCRRITIR
jgi:hypothetical protein